MRLAYLAKKKLLNQAIGFLLAGGVANIVSLSFYIFSFKFIGIDLIYSSILGQILGLLFNYIINSRLVFKKNISFDLKLFFFSYYLIAIYLVGLFIQFFSEKGFNYILSWFVCTFIATLSNFLFTKFLIFKK